MLSQKTIQKLELERVLEMVAVHAKSEVSKRKILEEGRRLAREWPLPLLDLQKQLDATGEARRLISHAVSPDFGFDDATEALEKARVVSPLSFRELLLVMRLLRSSRNVKLTLEKFNAEPIPIIAEKVRSIFIDKTLEDDIDFAILSDTDINDKASDKLYSIRQKIRRVNNDVREKLASYTRSKSNILQDAIITIRNGRYCIPVKQEYKGSVEGMIHDQSSSGATLFIEPIAIINLNNELRTLALEEQDEIAQIVHDFTLRIYSIANSISENENTISDIDVYFSRAHYSYDTKSSMPLLNERGYVDIKNGRHPLIAPKKIVPLTIALGKSYSVIVVTGPNTGGKTVCLKAVGLLCLMAYCGLFIPAQDESSVALFDNIFCDIGDEQSIEQSLSTFSSHIKNITAILGEYTAKSLVLLDEVCAGTEPNEGSALAVAICEHILATGARAVLTTHYSRLKEFSLVTEGIENASMEFNPETFVPTYRLIMGVPGSSNAIEIAKHLGLNTEIIESARRSMTQGAVSFESVLQNAERLRRSSEEKLEAAQKTKSELDVELGRAKEKNKMLAAEREKLLAGSRVEAAKVVSIAKEEAAELLDELKEIINRAGLDEKALFAARSVVNKIKKIGAESETADDDFDYVFQGNAVNPAKLKPADRVFVRSLGVVGSVVKLEKNNKVTVSCGGLVSVVPIAELFECSEKQVDAKAREPARLKIRNDVKSEINLLGQTVEEAIYNVDKFIDDAAMSGLSTLRVVHGMGTGKLRQGLHRHFEKHPLVAEFRLGVFGEGENGVTILKLK